MPSGRRVEVWNAEDRNRASDGGGLRLIPASLVPNAEQGKQEASTVVLRPDRRTEGNNSPYRGRRRNKRSRTGNGSTNGHNDPEGQPQAAHRAAREPRRRRTPRRLAQRSSASPRVPRQLLRSKSKPRHTACETEGDYFKALLNRRRTQQQAEGRSPSLQPSSVATKPESPARSTEVDASPGPPLKRSRGAPQAGGGTAEEPRKRRRRRRKDKLEDSRMEVEQEAEETGGSEVPPEPTLLFARAKCKAVGPRHLPVLPASSLVQTVVQQQDIDEEKECPSASTHDPDEAETQEVIRRDVFPGAAPKGAPRPAKSPRDDGSMTPLRVKKDIQVKVPGAAAKFAARPKGRPAAPAAPAATRLRECSASSADRPLGTNGEDTRQQRHEAAAVDSEDVDHNRSHHSDDANMEGQGAEGVRRESDVEQELDEEADEDAQTKCDDEEQETVEEATAEQINGEEVDREHAEEQMDGEEADREQAEKSANEDAGGQDQGDSEHSKARARRRRKRRSRQGDRDNDLKASSSRRDHPQDASCRKERADRGRRHQGPRGHRRHKVASSDESISPADDRKGEAANDVSSPSADDNHGVVSQAALVGKLHALIHGVYERCNPANLDKVPALLQKYRDSELQLYRSVCEKYGEAPEEINDIADRLKREKRRRERGRGSRSNPPEGEVLEQMGKQGDAAPRAEGGSDAVQPPSQPVEDASASPSLLPHREEKPTHVDWNGQGWPFFEELSLNTSLSEADEEESSEEESDGGNGMPYLGMEQRYRAVFGSSTKDVLLKAILRTPASSKQRDADSEYSYSDDESASAAKKEEAAGSTPAAAPPATLNGSRPAVESLSLSAPPGNWGVQAGGSSRF